MIMTKEENNEVSSSGGSVRNLGDRVCFIYFEDESGTEYGYGTVINVVDNETALVEVKLPGRRRKQMVDHLEIPFKDLKAHVPEFKSEE